MTRPPHVSGPYLDNANEWRWSIVAGNGETIAVSSEGYKNRADCLHGQELARQALNLERSPRWELCSAASWASKISSCDPSRLGTERSPLRCAGSAADIIGDINPEKARVLSESL